MLPRAVAAEKAPVQRIGVRRREVERPWEVERAASDEAGRGFERLLGFFGR